MLYGERASEYTNCEVDQLQPGAYSRLAEPDEKGKFTTVSVSSASLTF